MIRFLALNATGALLLLGAAGAGWLFIPYQADITGITSLISVLFLVGLWRAWKGDWDSASWISLRLIHLGLLGTMIGFAIALARLDPTSFADMAALRTSGAALLTGASVAVYTSIVGWIGALWLDLNRRLIAPSTAKKQRT